jgi:hypothetical protein
MLEKQGSKYPHYMEGAVMLANGEALEFLDQLKNENRPLGADDLRKLSRLASIIKEVNFIIYFLCFFSQKFSSPLCSFIAFCLITEMLV